MSPASVLAAVLAAGAVGASIGPRPRLGLGSPRGQGREAPSGSLLLRLRVPITALVMIGAGVFVSGMAGVLVAPVVGVFAWRVLGRAEDPARIRERARIEADLPGAVDLLVLCLGSGAAPGPSLRIVATAMEGPVTTELSGLARRLEMGTDPAQVWRELAAHPQLGPLGRALARAHASGSSVTEAGRSLALELHDRARVEVEDRARGVAARAAAPLGVCFLPAFVLLGIVPLIAGLVRGLDIFGR